MVEEYLKWKRIEDDLIQARIRLEDQLMINNAFLELTKEKIKTCKKPNLITGSKKSLKPKEISVLGQAGK